MPLADEQTAPSQVRFNIETQILPLFYTPGCLQWDQSEARSRNKNGRRANADRGGNLGQVADIFSLRAFLPFSFSQPERNTLSHHRPVVIRDGNVPLRGRRALDELTGDAEHEGGVSAPKHSFCP